MIHCRLELFVEMACNGLFGAGEGTQISPPNPNKQFTLAKANLAVIDRDVKTLILDLQVLTELARVGTIWYCGCKKGATTCRKAVPVSVHFP